jgi:hypothetical protein
MTKYTITEINKEGILKKIQSDIAQAECHLPRFGYTSGYMADDVKCPPVAFCNAMHLCTEGINAGAHTVEFDCNNNTVMLNDYIIIKIKTRKWMDATHPKWSKFADIKSLLTKS